MIFWHSIKGDLESFEKFGLPAYRFNKFCVYCPADQGGRRKLWPTYFHSDAEWMANPYTAAFFRENFAANWFILALFTFLSCFNIDGDELHIMYIGVCQYLLGSVLWLLVFVILGDTPAVNMKKVWRQIQIEYSRQGSPSQYTGLRISSFISASDPHSGFPRLKGAGAEVKWLMPVMLVVWRELARDADARETQLQSITASFMFHHR